MTMQTPHSPKPKIFGDGYGKHVSHHYQLMKKFFGLGLKMFVNMFIPGIFYERAHWEVIDLYYKMQGYRHGTNDAKRCDECGSNLISSDDKLHQPSKAIEPEPEPIEEINQQAGDFTHPEENPLQDNTLDHD